MNGQQEPAARSRGEALWLRPVRVPAFFLCVIVFQELFLKLYCFHVVPVRGVVYTMLFSAAIALALGLWCVLVKPKTGQILLVCITAVLSLWMTTQTVYYYLFETFMSLGSLTKVGMVAGEFGGLAVINVLKNWFPVLMLCLPTVAAIVLRGWLVCGERPDRKETIHWAAAALVIQMLAVLCVLSNNDGAMSPYHVYNQPDAPELTVTNFGMLTHTRLEFKRIVFGVKVEEDEPETLGLPLPDFLLQGSLLSELLVPESTNEQEQQEPQEERPVIGPNDQVLDIDFERLMGQEEDETLLAMHDYFAGVSPTQKNRWTGYFEGKNLVWIVAEAFSTLAVDPELTPTLYRLSREGFVFNRFYTPLWGVSTSDGEYVTTTGLIPRAGVWSYLESADNYMPFGFGNLFSPLGYRTLAYHNNTYTYYGRDLSYPNMGYEYYGLGNGLEVTRSWPESDLEMMELSVPQYIDEEHFMVYYLTVSGHLNYNTDQNDMALKHWDTVADLPYSEGPKAYLACQMELDKAVESLISQLEAAGKLEDTVIVLSGDHYPYGLQDEEIGQLLGHEAEPNFEKYKSTLILWNAEMEQPVQVDKLCSSLDVMPTLANLFGLEYDSRLLAGRDILSDEPGLVIFFNYNFLSEEGMYVSATDTFTPWEGETVEPGYVEHMLEQIRDRVSYSALILDEDYYRVVFRPEQSEN